MSQKQKKGELVCIDARSKNFAYEIVSPPVARFLREQADRIRRSAAASIVNVGKDLIAAKHYLSHGTFLTWVESEVGIPARTAQAYMQVAHWASRKTATIAHLPPSLLYLLSAPSTPKVFIDEILKRVEDGKPVALGSVRGELKAFRSGKRNGDCAEAYCEQFGNATEIGAEINPPEIVAPNGNCNEPLMKAVSIVMHALSASDFAKVRELLTSKSVLEDPDLPHSIETAFSAVERSVDVSIVGESRMLQHEENGVQYKIRAPVS